MIIRENIEKKLLAGFGIIFAIVVVVVVAAVRNSTKTSNSADWVNHTHAFILEVDGIFTSLNHAEATHKSYLMSGSDGDRSIFRLAASEVSEHLGVAKASATKGSSMETDIGEIESLVTRRLDTLDSIVKTRMEKGYEAAKAELNAPTSRELFEKIRKGITALKQSLDEELHRRDQEANRNTRRTRQILFTGLGLNFVLLASLFFLLKEDLELRRASAKLMQEYNDSLEQKVKDRTKELETANSSLEVENLERRWMAEAAERQYIHNELIIQCIEAGVYVITRNGTITKLNPYGGWLAGCDPAILVGKSIELILPLASGERTWRESKIYKAIVQDESLVNIQAALLRKDGSTMPVHYNARSMRAEGKVVGAVVTVFGHPG